MLEEYPVRPRLVNRFKVGADPEFAFWAVEAGERRKVHAHQLQFIQDTAWGADGSGRQVELRPVASRFVVDVVASIAATLYEMVKAEPRTLKLHWAADAYDGYDGYGGHVHFGRRRLEHREREVEQLDWATEALAKAGTLFEDGYRRRQMCTQYGRLHDYRTQAYGYEYRTLPCWLARPKVAHMVLTVAKLASYLKVGDTEGLKKFTTDRAGLTRLLRLFAHSDDDAQLALTGNWPTWGMAQGEDFKTAWGFRDFVCNDSRVASAKAPIAVEPSAATRRAVWHSIRKDNELVLPRVVVEPSRLADGPDGFRRIIVGGDGRGCRILDLWAAIGEPVRILATTDSSTIAVPKHVATSRLQNLWNTFPYRDGNTPMSVHSGQPISIWLPKAAIVEEKKWTNIRAWLLKGALPIWETGKIPDRALEIWLLETAARQNQEKHLGGRTITWTREGEELLCAV